METRQGEGQDKIAGVIFSFIWFIIIYNFSCFKIQGLLFICRDSQNTVDSPTMVSHVLTVFTCI
jgi:hypothetical protein